MKIKKERNIEYQVKKQMEYIEIGKGLAVYKYTTVVESEEINELYVCEGIAEIEKLETVDLVKCIISDSKYDLIKKDVVELHRTVPTGWVKGDYFNRLSEYMVVNPYTVMITEEDFHEKYGFFRFDCASEKMYDIEDKEVPKAKYFGDLSGRISNEFFDLGELLIYLRKRKDVCILDEGIKDMPYFNATKECTKYINFIYAPTDEDFKKMQKAKNEYGVQEVIREILELNRFQLG